MKSAKQTAIELFGKEKVASIEALQFVAQDADALYATLVSQGDEDGAEIVRMLYFNEE